jgi:glucosylceramidase
MRSHGSGWLAASLAGLLLAACALPPAPPTQARPPRSVQAWLSTGDRSQLLAPQAAQQLAQADADGQLVEVDTHQRYQRMLGFGAAMTDASAWLLQHRQTPGQREALMRELFGRQDGGLGLSFMRLSIGASDFSLQPYSLDDMPPGASDPSLAHFSIAPLRADLLPVLHEALRINPQLQLMASPWSAPGWMKTSDSLIQGTLREDRQDVFAHYLRRYTDAMAAEGIDLFALSVQNEPHFEPVDYPGMRIEPAARAALVGRHLGPLLAQRDKPVQIIEWDHNWDLAQAPLAMLADVQARRYVDGVGWHCYAGDARAQSVVHDAYPDKDTWFTECSGGEWMPAWPQALPWMMREVLIGSTRHWARGVLLWNLALDEHHGPRLGGCTDCRGVVTIDSQHGDVTRNLEYYVLGHASRFIRPGAWRIASSPGQDGIDSVAFQNADDGSVVLLLCNSAAAPRTVRVRESGQTLSQLLPGQSVATLVWRP